ncbi:hypothetical protein B0H13DRAFT_1647725 [Mycena leptocephala]|nr:hypothetical protein B0H13DRAFT_1647725 [Mycena leptocephala]
MHGWRPLRDEYLQEFLRQGGLGDVTGDICASCGVPGATIRCTMCFGELLYCDACCVNLHRCNPLHIIDRWNGVYFERTTLAALGLRIQFGHADCLRPVRKDKFVVVDLGYIHVVAADFCGCEQRAKIGHPRTQLLCRRWYPATHDIPNTAATFRCLDFFLLQTLQAKTTMYDFYGALEKATDAMGVSKPPKRYVEFLRIARQYRHLLMLKRGGRGHAPSGVDGTKPGELAIQCPACPRPGVNLPDDWEKAPPELKFLYILFLALDACFRLKRRLVSSDLRDPGLGTGWSYFVENEPYRQYLLSVTDQKEMSTCSGLAALDYANTKFSRGYSTTGVGMCVCARHEFVQATGVGDLQKGERYANMDWIFAAVLRWKDERLFKIISYDIICQWWKHLMERLLLLPPLVRVQIILLLFAFVIPKLHLHAHILACQLVFSLNFLLGAAQTDGEGIERPWANLGGVATSTREMGPGSRHDVLDCHLHWWNWCKLVTIGALLRKRYDVAVQEHALQDEAFATFSVEQAANVLWWRKMVEEYEEEAALVKDATQRKKKNPYHLVEKGLTEASVRLQFSEEEAANEKKGVPSLHDVSPSTFVYVGLELEDEQRRVRVQAELKKAGTTAQKIDVLALRRKLNRGISRFRKLQMTYTPGALQALSRLPAKPEELPEDTPLMLPSALKAEERRVGCVAGVDLIEVLARDAQCCGGLHKLRNQLHIKSRLTTYKKNNARHQGANTRSRMLVARNESKIRLHSEKYQAAWSALYRLHDGDTKKFTHRMLRKEDIRLMEDSEELTRKEAARRKQDARRRKKLAQLRREGEIPNRVVSWIWTGAGSEGTDAELEEALRIEWAKAYSRTRRWKEQVLMLAEEYRRVGESFEHDAQVWEAHVAALPECAMSPEVTQGAIAYGTQQAAMYRALAKGVVTAWTEEHRGRGRQRVPRPPNVEEGEEQEEGADDDSNSDDAGWAACSDDELADEDDAE